MSEENIEIVRRIYESFNARELPRGLELIDRDFEWIPDKRDPAPPVRGREEVLRFLQDQIEMLGMEVELEEAFQKGEEVVAFICVRGEGRASGVEINIRVASLWTFQDGTPVRGQAYAVRAEALEAAGLSE
jgi:ketosteroid isomerase-like protein